MARHLVTFYLEGGHEVPIEVNELEVGINEETGQIANYTIKSVPEEELSYLFFAPGAIVGIKSVLLEGDDEQEDSDTV